MHDKLRRRYIMKRFFIILLILAFTLGNTVSFAESPQAALAGSAPSGDPPIKPDGATPGGAAPGGMPGGQSSQPDSYSTVNEYSNDQTLDVGTYASTGTDENAIHVLSGALKISNSSITRVSTESSGGDGASFYGVGAALLVTGGTAYISDSDITTDASGGAGVFAYGDGVAYVLDTTINTTQGASGGIHVAGGGTLYAKNLTVETDGSSSAAIRSDRGSGTMVVDGGTYVSNGTGSPAVYCTADISINNATLTATGSEALCLEGLNTVRLYDSSLTGSMADLSQNDNTWTVILYQSMSGDSQVGEGKFEMVGGSLASENGGVFYTTNTQSEFILSNVTITAAADCEYFLRCTGNTNERGWGQTGANGADCKFTAISQQMNGNVLWDSISALDLYAISGSVLTGAVINDESCAGNGGDGFCNLYIDSSSSWVITGDSTMTVLSNEGTITDTDGKTVSIVGTDGTVYVQGDSQYAVTVSRYSNTCDFSNAGSASGWSEHAVAFE